jgi:tetratricopeptide (TPR) repeat protein
MKFKIKREVVTLAETYYLKAVEGYPYELEEVLENLNYALSYDEEHAGALYLMGCMQMEQLENYELAEDYLVSAIASNPNYFKAFKKYAHLTILTRQFDKTEGLIKHMFKIRGADWAIVYHVRGLWFEYQKMFDQAIVEYKLAKGEAYNKDFGWFIEDEIERVKAKIKPKGEWKMEMI